MFIFFHPFLCFSQSLLEFLTFSKDPGFYLYKTYIAIMSNNLVHGEVLGPLYDFGLFYIVMLFLNPVKTLGSEMGHGIATQEDVAYHGLVTD